MLILALALAADAPKEGDLHTFKDWIVGCDNVRVCQANALKPEEGIGDDQPMPIITRDAAPGAVAEMIVDTPDKTRPGAKLPITIDGKVVATAIAIKNGVVATVPLTRALLKALDSGHRLGVPGMGSASLAGLSAAMLYMDDQQHRLGTQGALKSVGTRPDSTVPPPPAAPVIRVPAPGSRPPLNLSVAEATRLIGDDAAKCDGGDPVKPEAYRLDPAHSLVLVPNPCGNGAYNYFTSPFIVDEAGKARPAQFDAQPGMGEAGDPAPQLTNGDWDPKTRTLSSYEKGRGIGDCGGTEQYAWDGTRFRLIEATMMGECRGSADFIRVWTARAVPAQ